MRSAGPVLILLAALLAGCLSDTPGEGTLADHGPAADLTGATGWIGSGPLTLSDLEGKVVLVDFWAYTCINCIRTLPHVTGWYDTYEDHGLVVIGVHAPEFEFEEERENVVEAMERHGIRYPVAQDNDMRVWRAYDNHYWPAKYLIDAQGHLRHFHFGEGAYAETEQHIRTLLREAGYDLPDVFEGSEKQRAGGIGVTPELYVGYGRQDGAVDNPEGYRPEESVSYDLSSVDRYVKDRVYLDGTWFNGRESLRAETDGTVYLTFKAGGANFVANGPEGECVAVGLDGLPFPAEHAPADVDPDRDPTCIVLDGARSYDFYTGPVETHTVAFHVPVGFELYTFAFNSYSEA